MSMFDKPQDSANPDTTTRPKKTAITLTSLPIKSIDLLQELGSSNMASTIRGHIREVLRGFSTDSAGPEGGESRTKVVKQLERRVVNLQTQVVDLQSRILESEERAAIEKRRKLDSKFKQKFKQQRLPAWQPILTADTVLPAFFLIGLLFVPLGVALLLFSDSVVEKEIVYTDCASDSEQHKNAVGEYLMCKDVLKLETFTLGVDKCTCKIPFNITQNLEKNVFMYYGLDNFYQNHRRYVKSRDDKQLQGQTNLNEIDNDCAPFDKDDAGRIYAPRGAIANSLFNDSLTLTFIDGITRNTKVKLVKTGIAWESDKNTKFQNPPGKPLNNETGGAFENTAKPPYWSQPIWQLDVNDTNNGYENEDLIVWMRTAAFPSFRKLYGKIDHSQMQFKGGMSPGQYVLTVDYNYPVHSFGGGKRMILSTTSFLGGKNNFLGIAYITVGCVCFLLGVIFLVIHVKFGERTTKHLNINQNTPYQE